MTNSKQSLSVEELRERLASLHGALTPSGDTKAAYHGEFAFDVPLDGYDEDGEPLDGTKRVYVPWTTTKEIMVAILGHAALRSRSPLEDNSNG
jgi:hypothetical protein